MDVAIYILHRVVQAGFRTSGNTAQKWCRIACIRHLKKVAAKNDVLLLVDEVISFRLAAGGAQQIFDVQPDLTALGKTIGGGLPVGAFGGREDVMAVYSPKLNPAAASHERTTSGDSLRSHSRAAKLVTNRAG